MNLKALENCESFLWINPKYQKEPLNLALMGLSPDQISQAKERFDSFAPLLSRLFPLENMNQGRIESPLKEVSDYYNQHLGPKNTANRIFLKLDSQLPIAGSIKARGGIYEVLLHTEDIFRQLGFDSPIQTIVSMTQQELCSVLKDHRILVGSTGNLGLSIGIMSAKLGYHVEVHMSRDAKDWKKQLLRSHGATVVEHSGDYSAAVTAARAISQTSQNAYFIDDENSTPLFLGYAVAALELEKQLGNLAIQVSAKEPLTVVIPCGVGGAPGGICYGLKSVFGDSVHVYFAEPTHAPCMTLGLMTGKHDGVSVEEYGIELKTLADGLAVGRPSQFAGLVIDKLISGTYTLTDESMVEHMKSLYQETGEFVEPSAACALEAPYRVDAKSGTMVLWMTGGRLVPDDERQKLLK